MALSIFSLTTTFTSLSFSSSSSHASTSKTQALSFRRRNPRLAISASAAEAAEAVEAQEQEAEEIPAEETVELEGVALRKYVKERLPGGFAAQRLVGTGRRKTAIARVVLQEGTGKVIINYRDARDYMQGNPLWLEHCKIPLMTLGFENSYDIFVKAEGGGLSGQAQAISLGVARALLKVSKNNRIPLKREGLLTRDARIVERKKAGLKKARKRPQFSKR